MGLVLRISIADLSLPQLERMERVLADRLSLDKAAAQGALPEFQGRIREMASGNRNPFGERSTFWNMMLAGTKAGADGGGGFVRMPRAVGLRYHGGRVVPKKAKMLAIPARSEAYGKSPRQFADLRFIPTKRGGGMLIQNPQTMIVRKKNGRGKGSVKETVEMGGGVMFWLVKSAYISADQSVLPTPEAITGAAMRGVRTLIALRVRRTGQW